MNCSFFLFLVRKFRLGIFVGCIRIYVHDSCFHYRGYLIVCHCAFHAGVKVLLRPSQIRSLYQHISTRLFLCSTLIIQCDEAQLAFKPAVIAFGVAGENFAVVGTLDVRYCKLSGDKGSHLLDYPCFRLRETEGIYQIRFCYFFLHSVFNDFLVTDFTFKPRVHSHNYLSFFRFVNIFIRKTVKHLETLVRKLLCRIIVPDIVNRAANTIDIKQLFGRRNKDIRHRRYYTTDNNAFQPFEECVCVILILDYITFRYQQNNQHDNGNYQSYDPYDCQYSGQVTNYGHPINFIHNVKI
uniref:Uncharacterized protein n=1 Tax=Myoviridae sp. ctcFb5 TaxID=2825137 RepID=A0A8S5PVU5_9CAUD|nr:MAG TPA: hypothetical protein [Myoviridae sp. ctcFb5]DAP86557.1 MAG TPA: hypothetical protein [Caudoviricetes sp.]